MIVNPPGPGRKTTLAMAGLLSGLVVIALVIAVAVFATASTSARSRKEATEAVLLAEMQAALEQVTAHALAAQLSDTSTPPPSVDLSSAQRSFVVAETQLEDIVDGEELDLMREVNSGFAAYVDTVAALMQGEQEPGLENELRSREYQIRSPLLALQLEENEHLLESIEAEARAFTLLEVLVPGLLVVAALLSVLAARLQTRSRRLTELEALQQARDEFVASVSHQLRTPLSAVVGVAAELRDRIDAFQTHEVVELVTLIAEQSDEVSDIVEDLLVAARLDAGSLTVIAEQIDVRTLVENSLVPFRGYLQTECEIDGHATALADPRRVRQILRNLISNAVRHGGTRIRITVEQAGQEVALTVDDDGPGLPESEWDTIFEAYHRAHEEPGNPASIGLGLTVSRRLAQQMSGTLSYRHTDGWSSFALVLPAATPLVAPVDQLVVTDA